MAEESDLKRTRAELIRSYSSAPGLLARELDYVLGRCSSTGDMAVHNKVMADISIICPDRKGLLMKVASAIIEFANSTEEQVNT